MASISRISMRRSEVRYATSFADHVGCLFQAARGVLWLDGTLTQGESRAKRQEQECSGLTGSILQPRILTH